MTGASKIGRLLLAASCVAVVGCARGPTWRPERFTLPALLPHEPIKAVAVWDFYASFFEEREKGEMRYLEGPRFDISADIAMGLRETGLDARAPLHGRPEQLNEGEVLLRGAIRCVRPAGLGPDAFQCCAAFLTVGVYGCVVPFFVPVRDGLMFEVRVGIVDRKSNFLLSTTKELEAVYEWNSAWDMPLAKNQVRALLSDLKAQVVAEIAKRLRE